MVVFIEEKRGSLLVYRNFLVVGRSKKGSPPSGKNWGSNERVHHSAMAWRGPRTHRTSHSSAHAIASCAHSATLAPRMPARRADRAELQHERKDGGSSLRAGIRCHRTLALRSTVIPLSEPPPHLQPAQPALPDRSALRYPELHATLPHLPEVTKNRPFHTCADRAILPSPEQSSSAQPLRSSMTRSIVLRYDATCHDCGSQLEAGTTARWFGRGRVSCCGGSQPGSTPSNRERSSPVAPAAPVASAAQLETARTAARLDAADPEIREQARLDALSTAQRRADAHGWCNGFARQELLRATYVNAFLKHLASMPIEAAAIDNQQAAAAVASHDKALADALQQGLTPELLARVAASQPTLRLLVRLQSGARFIVPAEHAQHVVRCVEESCIDRVRDIMRAAQ